MRLADIEAVIERMAPLPGAREFLDELRDPVPGHDPVGHVLRVRPSVDAQAWLADIVLPPAAGGRCGRPHRLPVADARPEAAAVQAFQGLNFCVVAVGDSYNDTSMLGMADVGFFLHAPEQIAHQFPDFRAHHDYDALLESIDRVAKGFP